FSDGSIPARFRHTWASFVSSRIRPRWLAKRCQRIDPFALRSTTSVAVHSPLTSHRPLPARCSCDPTPRAFWLFSPIFMNAVRSRLDRHRGLARPPLVGGLGGNRKSVV